MYKSLLTAGLMATKSVYAQTDEEKAKFPLWQEAADAKGFGWRPYEITTSDGYKLNLFRITHFTDKDGNYRAVDARHHYPVLMKHGAQMDATAWVQGGMPQDTYGLQLAYQGYDVWFASDRGTKYSREHVNQDTMSLQEYWDFNWATMATIDVPAQVDRILAETNMSKLTYVGYSQGTAQMFYAMAHNQDYYAERINRFVAMAPCVIMFQKDTYDNYKAQYLKLRELGVYNIHGYDDSGTTTGKTCGIIDRLCYAENATLQAWSVGNELYYSQLETVQRFQEPIPLDDWVKGQFESDLVDLSAIDRVPVSMIVGADERTCPIEHQMMFYAKMQTPEKYLMFDHGYHTNGIYSTRDRVTQFIQTVERGYAGAVNVFATSFAMLSALALAIQF